MSIGGLFLALAFFVGIVTFILWPVLVRRENSIAPHEDADVTRARLRELHAEREALLIALRDLDFDQQTGKFDEQDYESQRESLMRRGVEILQQIDALESDVIETAVRARRGV